MRAALAIVLMIVATGMARTSVIAAGAIILLSLFVMSRSDTSSESSLLGIALLATLLAIGLGVST